MSQSGVGETINDAQAEEFRAAVYGLIPGEVPHAEGLDILAAAVGGTEYRYSDTTIVKALGFTAFSPSTGPSQEAVATETIFDISGNLPTRVDNHFVVGYKGPWFAVNRGVMVDGAWKHDFQVVSSPAQERLAKYNRSIKWLNDNRGVMSLDQKWLDMQLNSENYPDGLPDREEPEVDIEQKFHGLRLIYRDLEEEQRFAKRLTEQASISRVFDQARFNYIMNILGQLGPDQLIVRGPDES